MTVCVTGEICEIDIATAYFFVQKSFNWHINPGIRINAINPRPIDIKKVIGKEIVVGGDISLVCLPQVPALTGDIDG